MPRKYRVDETRWRCGCPRTPENTTTGKHGQCLTCKRKAGRKWWEKKGVGITKKTHLRGRAVSERTMRRRRAQARAERQARASSPACQLYQAEKAKRAQRINPLIAAAKVELERQLEAQRAAGKGGRPKGSKSKTPDRFFPVQPNRFPNVQEDPRDALLNSLGHFSGTAA